MKGLWADESWAKRDVEQVHVATRRILQALLIHDEAGADGSRPDCSEVDQGAPDPSGSGGTVARDTDGDALTDRNFVRPAGDEASRPNLACQLEDEGGLGSGGSEIIGA